MCRWMAWLGQPVQIDELLFKTQHGIVDQSLHARMGAEPTNGDGFGLGWYGTGEGPARYHSVSPAWADANLRELAAHVESPLFLAHVRAAIGSPVQQTNCHPFRHGRWLFVHNGFVNELKTLRRDLALLVDPALFGVTDGTCLWAVRYATDGAARSLFTSADVGAIRRLHRDNPRLQRLGADDRLVVSEPFSDLPGVWDAVPQGT